MSNTFRRPMFRRGGEAMTGIMNNITPRVNRFAGTPESYVTDYTEQLRNAAGSYSGVDPLTAWLLRAGPKMMNEPKRGGSLATILRATEEPTEQAIGDINKRAMGERDIRLAGAQLGLSQYGKEHLQKYKSDATNVETLSDLEKSILKTTQGYLDDDTYTDRNLATNRATYDHNIQGKMIEKFGSDQIIDVEMVPAKKKKYSRSEEKNKQKFYENNIGNYFYDINDNTIKKIIKDPSDPTGNLLTLDTFNSETLERIPDPVGGDIDGGEKEEIEITDSSIQFQMTDERAKKEAEERGYVLLDVNDPNFEYRKLYDNTAITKEELENLVRKELAKEKRKTIVQKTRK